MMRTAMKSGLTMFEEHPSEFISREYTQKEKGKILGYMSSFEYYGVAGLVYDCVTGEVQLKENGRPYEDVAYHDGEFCWCEQDMYHIKRYNAAVTDEFFQKVMGQAIA